MILLCLDSIPGVNTIFKRRDPFQGGHPFNAISPKIEKLMTSNFEQRSSRYVFMSVYNFISETLLWEAVATGPTPEGSKRPKMS